MVGNVYLYPKNERTYRVLMETKMKDPTTGEWKPAVIYTDGDASYCREKEDFINKFKPIENGQGV